MKPAFSCIHLILWLLHLWLPSIASAQGSSPCSEHAFEFWIGGWRIEARNRPPGAEQWTKNAAWIKTNVRSALTGCIVIEESMDVSDADTVIVGMSITSFNTYLNKYQQLWVDQNGFTWEYLGGWEGENMVLYLEAASSDGTRAVPFQETTLIRMVFGEIQRDRLVWRYQYSTDEGRTWVSTNEAIYTRIK